jgi:hypothetical protein
MRRSIWAHLRDRWIWTEVGRPAKAEEPTVRSSDLSGDATHAVSIANYLRRGKIPSLKCHANGTSVRT